MHPNTDDNDLRTLFAAMQQEETQQAPVFESVWDEAAARAERHRRRVVWMRYAAAAVLLMGLALSAVFLLRPREAMSITEWQSPTAGLLPVSTTMLDASLPTAALLSPPSPRLEAYVPETQVLWPDEAMVQDADSEQ